MKKFLILFLLSLTITSCSSVSQSEPGHYKVTCHAIVTEENCSNNIEKFCSNGYTIVNREKDWSFFQGAQNILSVNCKE